MKHKKSPIYERRNIVSIEKLKLLFGIDDAFLYAVTEKKRPTLSNSENLRTLVEIADLLWQVSGGSIAKIHKFMTRPREEYLGLSPVDFMVVSQLSPKIALSSLRNKILGEAMGS